MALRVIWSPEARAGIRAIDRHTALRLLQAVGHFLKTGTGDANQLKGFDPPLFGLRVDRWRVIYRRREGAAIEVVRVRHRSEAYR